MNLLIPSTSRDVDAMWRDLSTSSTRISNIKN